MQQEISARPFLQGSPPTGKDKGRDNCQRDEEEIRQQRGPTWEAGLLVCLDASPKEPERSHCKFEYVQTRGRDGSRAPLWIAPAQREQALRLLTVPWGVHTSTSFQSLAVQTQAPRGPISAQSLPASPTTKRLPGCPERKEKAAFFLQTQLHYTASPTDQRGDSPKVQDRKAWLDNESKRPISKMRTVSPGRES